MTTISLDDPTAAAQRWEFAGSCMDMHGERTAAARAVY
jgi:hypothetical protein